MAPPQKQAAAGWVLQWEDDFAQEGAPDAGKWGFAGRKSPDWACYCADTSAATKPDAVRNEFRTVQRLPVRFTDTELAAIAERAEAAGTNSAAFVRAATLGAISAGPGDGGRQP